MRILKLILRVSATFESALEKFVKVNATFKVFHFAIYFLLCGSANIKGDNVAKQQIALTPKLLAGKIHLHLILDDLTIKMQRS